MYFLMKLCTSHIVRFHVRLSWVVSVIQPPFPTSVGNIPQSFFQENRKESPLNLGIFLHGSTCAVNTGPEHMYQHPSTKPIFSNKKEDVDQPNQPNKCHFFQQMHQQKRSALASLASLASRRKDGNHHFDAAKTGSSPGLTRGSNHSGNSVKLRPATLLKWEGKNPWWFPGSLNRRDR